MEMVVRVVGPGGCDAEDGRRGVGLRAGFAFGYTSGLGIGLLTAVEEYTPEHVRLLVARSHPPRMNITLA